MHWQRFKGVSEKRAIVNTILEMYSLLLSSYLVLKKYVSTAWQRSCWNTGHFGINFTLYDICFRAFNRSLANPYVTQQVICVQKVVWRRIYEYIVITNSTRFNIQYVFINMYKRVKIAIMWNTYIRKLLHTVYTVILLKGLFRKGMLKQQETHNKMQCPTCNKNEHNWSY